MVKREKRTRTVKQEELKAKRHKGIKNEMCKRYLKTVRQEEFKLKQPQKKGNYTECLLKMKNLGKVPSPDEARVKSSQTVRVSET